MQIIKESLAENNFKVDNDKMCRLKRELDNPTFSKLLLGFNYCPTDSI